MGRVDRALEEPPGRVAQRVKEESVSSHNGGPRRVVVTGMGVVTPVGKTVEEFWSSLLAGKSGTGPVTHFDASTFTSHIGAEVKDFEPEKYIDRKEARRMDRFTQFAVVAADEALCHSGLKVSDYSEDIGVIIGSGIGGLTTLEDSCVILHEKGAMRVSPLSSTMMIADIAAGQVSIRHQAFGPNFCITSACATGNNALGEAYEIVKRGDAKGIIAGSTEASLTPLGMAAFHRTGAVSTRNHDGEHASRPFDLDRDGFVHGEGAGILILEELEFAKARGANILAEIVGYGASADAYHVSAPDENGMGATRSMRRALEKAGLTPDDVDYINAHGTSTQLNDKTETIAIKRVFGERAYQIPVSSTKSMTGHLIGAAGSVEAVASIMTIRTGMIHPTINYETPDPDCDLDYVPNVARHQPVRVVLSNSFGFGGHNATLIIKAYEE
jgi:3-oxoacyl-[acyl-carrier-protein] synthase II